MRGLSAAHAEGRLGEALRALGLDEVQAEITEGFVGRQIEATGSLPDDRTIIVEHFKSDTENHQAMVHSLFGRRINSPLSILVQRLAGKVMSTDVTAFCDDDGFLLSPYVGKEVPSGILGMLEPDAAVEVLEAILPSTPLFNMTFRYNAARALMMGVRKAGRQPRWVQRVKGAEMLESLIGVSDHPLIRETRRECLEDHWDLEGLRYVIGGIRDGSIKVREIRRESPSPMSLTLRRNAEAMLTYDYAPTPSSVYRKVEEGLRHLLIKPDPEMLAKSSERLRLPEDERQLHSTLMAEGDFLADELPADFDWLLGLARQGRALYVDPGIWIAAEHGPQYDSAIAGGDPESQKAIVRRALRYRGAQTAATVADRYRWDDGHSGAVLEALAEGGEAVRDGELYYHADLYSRARDMTVRSRRMRVSTLPAQSYASLMAGRARPALSPAEQVAEAIKGLAGHEFPLGYWESILLPARVDSYRPALLDAAMAGGAYAWRIVPPTEPGAQARLRFEHYDDADWDYDLSFVAEGLEGDERKVYEALARRGATFAQGLYALLAGESPYVALMGLAEKGLVRSDGFMPVRQALSTDRVARLGDKARARARIAAMAGRWEPCRPTLVSDAGRSLDRAFDKVAVMCRETSAACGIPWSAALESLRVWEYTGRARRGYFVEGLSGIQFIRDSDYPSVSMGLQNPSEKVIWLSAVDPLLQWGKTLAHMAGREFTCIPGTAVGLKAGIPVAAFERQGQALRLFGEDARAWGEALAAFATEYAAKRVYGQVRKVSLKAYPKGAEEALEAAGFTRQMMEYALHQGGMRTDGG